jgi:AraC-like DNA-binding protein
MTEYLRHMIDDFGNTTLRQAAALHADNHTIKDICQQLGIDSRHVRECIAAGNELREIFEDQRRHHDAIIEPDYR